MINYFNSNPDIENQVKEKSWAIVESGNVKILKHFILKLDNLKPKHHIRSAIEHGHYDIIKYLIDLDPKELGFISYSIVVALALEKDILKK